MDEKKELRLNERYGNCAECGCICDVSEPCCGYLVWVGNDCEEAQPKKEKEKEAC